jgi:hypothetical protein
LTGQPRRGDAGNSCLKEPATRLGWLVRTMEEAWLQLGNQEWPHQPCGGSRFSRPLDQSVGIMLPDDRLHLQFTKRKVMSVMKSPLLCPSLVE